MTTSGARCGADSFQDRRWRPILRARPPLQCYWPVAAPSKRQPTGAQTAGSGNVCHYHYYSCVLTAGGNPLYTLLLLVYLVTQSATHQTWCARDAPHHRQCTTTRIITLQPGDSFASTTRTRHHVRWRLGRDGMTYQRSVLPATPSHGPAIPVWSTGRRSQAKQALELVASLIQSSRVVGYWPQEARAKTRLHLPSGCAATCATSSGETLHVRLSHKLPLSRLSPARTNTATISASRHLHWPRPICICRLDGPRA